VRDAGNLGYIRQVGAFGAGGGADGVVGRLLSHALTLLRAGEHEVANQVTGLPVSAHSTLTMTFAPVTLLVATNPTVKVSPLTWERLTM
jgi:hypothetical protein